MAVAANWVEVPAAMLGVAGVTCTEVTVGALDPLLLLLSPPPQALKASKPKKVMDAAARFRHQPVDSFSRFKLIAPIIGYSSQRSAYKTLEFEIIHEIINFK